MSEVLNAEIEGTEESGFSRRRVVAGVAWSLPVIATAIAAPAAAASPGPTPTATPASGYSVNGPQNIVSTATGGANHTRTGVVVPTTLSLKDLGGVTGLIKVELTIAPQTVQAAAPLISFATVQLGTTPVSFTPSPSGNTFKAVFTYALPTGATALDFGISGYTYNGQKKDSGTYSVTTVITFQERGTTKQLFPGSSINLVRL
ncbi:hypothetical protein QF031_000712 [Pseudarthrobacter defluvii]|uniref:hypothetical protein n=1 Tax=Pseudarthrobacter defluvii TaxID=410837 RepID=UPI00278544FA|nr:hypothetical protein [Pseudarthrobacter defluvii]MDQ0767963.1 hypothetical protein [Pseudarthrobacter defluvii]